VNSYRVALTTSAEKELNWLPAKLITRILGRLEKLASNPRPPGCKKLIGGDKQWRIRIGDWRVVYEINRPTASAARRSVMAPERIRRAKEAGIDCCCEAMPAFAIDEA
jgi:mRNA interferase RelE/StbE